MTMVSSNGVGVMVARIHFPGAWERGRPSGPGRQQGERAGAGTGGRASMKEQDSYRGCIRRTGRRPLYPAPSRASTAAAGAPARFFIYSRPGRNDGVQNSMSTGPPLGQSDVGSDAVIRCAASDSFQDWISRCGGALAVTTYQAGKVA